MLEAGRSSNKAHPHLWTSLQLEPPGSLARFHGVSSTLDPALLGNGYSLVSSRPCRRRIQVQQADVHFVVISRGRDSALP